MDRDSLVPYQQEVHSLLAQFPNLPKATQQQIVDRVSHIIAVAIVAQIGTQANTALYLDEAGKALQMTGTYHMLSQLEPYLPPEMKAAFRQSFASAMAGNRTIRTQLEQHILSDIRSLRMRPPAEAEHEESWNPFKGFKLFGPLDEEM